ncbi:MAG TPA: hypothetical protein VMP08_00695 [Anaerolineae bacterium]|nr:hypothetical protein [Anaerolineae bacterium]
MKKDRLIPATIVGLLAVYSAWYVVQPGGPSVLLHLTHILFAICAWLAAILALHASRTFEPGVSSRHVWVLLGAGMTALAISETLWIAYHVVGQPIPYPSLVDILWGIGFVPILASLVVQYRALHVQLSRNQKLLMLVIYLGLLLLALVVSLGYILSSPGEVAVVQLLVGAYYLIGSLGVAFIATLSLMYLRGGLVARPWVYIVISILMFAVAGLAFSFGTWTNTYATGSNFLSAVSDVGYLAGYLSAAAGAYRQLTLRLSAMAEE